MKIRVRPMYTSDIENWRTTKHRNWTSEFFHPNIGTSDIGRFTRIGRSLMKIGLIHQICDRYTGIMQEWECTAMAYNQRLCLVLSTNLALYKFLFVFVLTNYLSLREILIKCCKHSQKQLKVPSGEWQCQMQRILPQSPYQLFSQFYTAASLLDVQKQGK